MESLKLCAISVSESLRLGRILAGICFYYYYYTPCRGARGCVRGRRGANGFKEKPTKLTYATK